MLCDDEVGAELDRPLEVRARERVVDDEPRRRGGARASAAAREVGEPHHRVGRRLDEQHPRRRRDRALDRVEVATCRRRRTTAGSACSTLSNSRNVPPYVLSETTTWSPDLSSVAMAPMAAMPEANANPALPPSIAAMLRSSAIARRVLRARVLVALVLAERLLHVGRRLVDRRDDGAGRRDPVPGRRGGRSVLNRACGVSFTIHVRYMLLISRSPRRMPDLSRLPISAPAAADARASCAVRHAAGPRDRRRRRDQAARVRGRPGARHRAAVPRRHRHGRRPRRSRSAPCTSSFRLLVLAKRRLLWRVRRKLILSYIFVGFVPGAAHRRRSSCCAGCCCSTTSARTSCRAGCARSSDQAQLSGAEHGARDSARRRPRRRRASSTRRQANAAARVSRACRWPSCRVDRHVRQPVAARDPASGCRRRSSTAGPVGARRRRRRRSPAWIDVRRGLRACWRTRRRDPERPDPATRTDVLVRARRRFPTRRTSRLRRRRRPAGRRRRSRQQLRRETGVELRGVSVAPESSAAADGVKPIAGARRRAAGGAAPATGILGNLPELPRVPRLEHRRVGHADRVDAAEHRRALRADLVGAGPGRAAASARRCCSSCFVIGGLFLIIEVVALVVGPRAGQVDHRIGARAVHRHRARPPGRLHAQDRRDGAGSAGRAGASRSTR